MDPIVVGGPLERLSRVHWSTHVFLPLPIVLGRLERCFSFGLLAFLLLLRLLLV
jgi:hypothetical protein